MESRDYKTLCETYSELFSKNDKHVEITQSNCENCQEISDAWATIMKELIPKRVIKLRKEYVTSVSNIITKQRKDE